MQFHSVGAKNIEADRLKGMAHAIAFDSSFTDTITDSISLFNALPKIKAFIESFDGNTFVSTPCAGQTGNRFYLAMSGNMLDVTTQSINDAAAYPTTTGIRTTEEIILLRHFYSHRADANIGTFADEYQSAYWGFNGANDKIGDLTWGSYIPRIIIQPDIVGMDTDMRMDKSSPGSFIMNYSFSQSIYSTTYRHWYGCSYLDLSSKVYTFGRVGSAFTWNAGSNIIGQFKKKSLVVFQGGQSYTTTGGSSTTSGSYRYNAQNGVNRTGEGGVHQPYVLRSEAEDAAKAISSIYFGLSHLDKNIIVKLSAGTDFNPINANPRDVLNISKVASANFNLFPYYSVKL